MKSFVMATLASQAIQAISLLQPMQIEPIFDQNDYSELNIEPIIEVQVQGDAILERTEGPAKEFIKEALIDIKPASARPAMEDFVERVVENVVDDESPVDKPDVASYIEETLEEVTEDPVPALVDLVGEIKVAAADDIIEAKVDIKEAKQDVR